MPPRYRRGPSVSSNKRGISTPPPQATTGLLKLYGTIGYDTTSQSPNGGVAMGIVSVVVFLLRALLLPRAVIAAENLALRQQLAVLRMSLERRSVTL